MAKKKKLSVFSRATSESPSPPSAAAVPAAVDVRADEEEGDRTALQSPKAGSSSNADDEAAQRT